MFDFSFTVKYLNRLLMLTDHVVLLNHDDVSASGIEIGIMHCVFQVVIIKWYCYLHVPTFILVNALFSVLSLFLDHLLCAFRQHDSEFRLVNNHVLDILHKVEIQYILTRLA